MATQTQQSESDVKYLNAFLKNELASVETYAQCIEKTENPEISSSLASIQQSHQKRAQLLHERIQALGGSPASSPGVWGGIAKMLEGGAKLFGEKAAVSVLEEGEDRGRDSYKRDVSKLSSDNQRFVEDQIMPEQMRSHDVMHDIEVKVKRRH
jgi:bacterioferritin (cytochrome b1)